MLPTKILNPYITLLYLWGFRAYKSPAHFMWTTIKLTETLCRLSQQRSHSIES